jgi:hypothetical protein
MSRASTVPSELDLLCESCGYVLKSLPPEGRCPECGELIAHSLPTLRMPSPWEQGAGPTLKGFIRTTLGAIFVPSRFFRSLSISPPNDRSRSFAMIHELIASLLFGLAGNVHLAWLARLVTVPRTIRLPWFIVAAILTVAAFATLTVVTSIAARLTHWEATYRGLRMPLGVVRRGLRFHTAHFLPVAIICCIIIFGYALLMRYRLINSSHDLHYLYILSAAAIISCIYLFITYWIGMKNLMYANR